MAIPNGNDDSLRDMHTPMAFKILTYSGRYGADSEELEVGASCISA